jgi:hypothetical protein
LRLLLAIGPVSAAALAILPPANGGTDVDLHHVGRAQAPLGHR